jgi:hypothetical protein
LNKNITFSDNERLSDRNYATVVKVHFSSIFSGIIILLLPFVCISLYSCCHVFLLSSAITNRQRLSAARLQFLDSLSRRRQQIRLQHNDGSGEEAVVANIGEEDLNSTDNQEPRGRESRKCGEMSSSSSSSLA